MTQEYLLDSNIFIYYLKRDEKIRKLLMKLHREYFYLSTISHAEVLDGAKDPADFAMVQKALNGFVPLDFRSDVASAAMKLKKKNAKKLKFKDLLIAATALVEGLTLVTADKDFKSVKGLRIKLITL